MSYLSNRASGSSGVTSVSNSDGTLTISPTTGVVVASLNLGNANAWTAQQTLGANTRFRATAVTGGVAYAQFETGLSSGAYANQFGAGTTVPADTTAGWSGAAIFTDADATDFNRTWINIGTSASSAFRRIAYLNTNGQLAFEDGTAALPIYSFASDPDTGMTSLGANTLGFSAGGTTRFQVNSGTNVNFALQVNFSSSTAPSAAVYGIGRGTTDLTTNVPTGAVHQSRINGTNIFTVDAGGVNIVPNGTATAPALTLGGFESGLYLTGGATVGITSQGTAVADFIGGGRIDLLSGVAAVTAGNFSIGRNGTNSELYLNAPTGNVIATRVNNVVNARFGGNTVGFYGVTPVTRATTAIAEAAIVAGAGAITVNEDTTFGGYTLQQIAQALQNIGILT